MSYIFSREVLLLTLALIIVPGVLSPVLAHSEQPVTAREQLEPVGDSIRPTRDAALTTLSQVGQGLQTDTRPLPTATQSAGVAPLIPVQNTPVPATPVNASEADQAELQAQIAAFDPMGRPVKDAGQDALVLLGVSGVMLIILYLTVSRYLANRDFSKYRKL